MILFLFLSVTVLDSARLIFDNPQSMKSLIFYCENDFIVDTFVFDFKFELLCDEKSS